MDGRIEQFDVIAGTAVPDASYSDFDQLACAHPSVGFKWGARSAEPEIKYLSFRAGLVS